jgi:hypothetical protein
MPSLDDKIDIKEARKLLAWWERLSKKERRKIARSIREFHRWLSELHALVRINKK